MSKPNLSKISNNSWDTEFNDIDNIIEQESSKFTPATNNHSGGNNTPTTNNYSNAPTPVDNPFVRQENDILNELEKVSFPTNSSNNSSLVNTEFKDSGTKTPQQNLNQPTNTPTQQQNNDSQNNVVNDPYLVAFEILQDFDFIRLPENTDLSQIDVQTLQMFKEETINEQRSEALEFVRSQMDGDPLMQQLFDYAYYGKKFADLPKMQTILKETYDFTNYDLSTETKQKNIIRLYYSDGLNPGDERDKKIIALIPTQIEQLMKEGQLKEEALNAKNFFINRSKEQAAKEEQRVLALLQQQDEIERQRELANRKWNDAFVKALQAKAWSEGRKANVISETKYVTLQNGEQMPLWQYKQNIILDNPALFQTFLDFMSQFNLETGDFKEKTTEENLSQNTLNQIVQRLQVKSNTNVHIQGSAKVTNPNVKQPKVVDVQRDWF